MVFKNLLLVGLSMFLFWQNSQAQEAQGNLNGSWLVVVEGESRTRTLQVMSTKQQSGGITVIDAEYGWTDGRKSSLQASVMKNASNLDELTFTTAAGSKVTAIQTGPGVFEGRIVNETDYDKKITIANEEVSKRLALILPTFDGHSGAGILAMKGVCHGTQGTQAPHAGIQA